jgi:alkyl hydroperoxide reductase subunit AhpC
MTPQIQKPAPDFQATAVINGQFKELKLADFKGKYLVRVLFCFFL